MNKIKRMICMVVTAVLAVSMLSLTVSAKQLTMELYGEDVTVDSSDIKTMKNKSSYSGDTSKTLYNWYKLTAEKEGKVTVDYTTKGKNTNIFLLNSDGEPVEWYNHSIDKGSLDVEKIGRRSGDNEKKHFYALSDGKKFKGSVSYSVKKGTYYLVILPGNSSTSYGGEYTFTVSFPQSSSKEKTSLSGDLKYLTLTVAEGDSFTLSASGASGSVKVKYSSSDTSVVTVSDKGRIKAKNPGSAEITVKCGKDTLVIKVTVTE